MHNNLIGTRRAVSLHHTIAQASARAKPNCYTLLNFKSALEIILHQMPSYALSFRQKDYCLPISRLRKRHRFLIPLHSIRNDS